MEHLSPESHSLASTSSIYVPEYIRIERDNWYKQHKKSQLNKVVQRYNPNHEEREFFYYEDVATVIDVFEALLNEDSVSGIRFYFASYTDVTAPSGSDEDQGKLALIYVPTTSDQESKAPVDIDRARYHISNADTTINLITKEEAIVLVRNYQRIKRLYLFETLSYDDQHAKRHETKHVLFEKETIQAIISIAKNPLVRAQGVKGIKIYITAYSDADRGRASYDHLLCQRLTFHFVFTDGEGEHIDLADIYKKDHGLAKIDSKVAVPNAYNTGFPTPPYLPDDGILDDTNS